MSSLLDIGRSGLLAAQTRLTVTGENIANADTEGYHRRDTITEEVGGARATVFSDGTHSQGVNVSEIRRAFDAILAARVRDSAGSVSEAQAQLPSLNLLEARLTPDEGGLLEMMDSYFSSLASLSGDPGDEGLRRVAITAAESFVESVSSLALDMENMIESTLKDASTHVDLANSLLRDLADVQTRIAVTNDSGALNPLLDQRDHMLVELAEVTDIVVEKDENGLVKISYGSLIGGPTLLDGNDVAQLVQDGIDRVKILPYEPTDPVTTRPVSGGALGGLSSAVSAINAALSDVNNWAIKIADEMNAVHAEGIDLDGLSGGDLFSLTGWKASSAITNKGTGVAEVTLIDPAIMPEGPIELVRDTAAGLWRALDEFGVELGSGDTQITLPGMVIGFEGTPQNGDRIDLVRREGNAADMHFLVSDPRKIAAAGAHIVSPDSENTGTGVLVVAASPPVATGLVELDASVGETALTAAEFLSPGVVGVVPAGTDSVTLATLDRQASLTFPVPGGQVSDLVMTIDGTTHTFTASPALVAADFVTALNDGTLLSTDGDRLSTLGGSVMISGTELLLDVSGATTLVTADLTATAGTTAATILADPQVAGDMAVFTRDGLQIAGTPMDPGEAEALLTVANGFLEGATYRMADLNSPDGYRGIDLTQQSAAGNHVAQLGTATGLATWSSGDVVPLTPAVTLGLTALDGGTVDIPEGTSAGQIADIIRDDVSGTVTARTDLSVDVPVDGKVTFYLTADNVSPILVTAQINSGDLETLAQAVNLASAGTGVSASLAPDGNRLILSNATGQDITMSGFTHDAGGTMTAERVDATGVPLGTGIATLGTGFDTSLRATGVVSLAAQQAFSVAEGATSVAAVTDPYSGGRVTRAISDAGATQTLELAFDPDTDIAANDGLTQVAGSALYTLSITGGGGDVLTATYDPASNMATSTADAAAGMAAALRQHSASSVIVAEPIAAIPADGSMLRVNLGDDLYQVTMVGGDPVVTGPEEGRLNAYFDGVNQLVIETTGGALDGSMLTMAASPGDAAAFGLGVSSNIQSLAIGGAVDYDTLPAGANTLNFTVDGTSYTLNAVNSGTSVAVSVGGGFAGSASYDAGTGRITITPPVGSGPVEVPQQAVGMALGFGSNDTHLMVRDGKLEVHATDSRVLSVEAEMVASGKRVTLDNLPNEDLIIAMANNGAPRMAATLTPLVLEEPERAVELRVLDAGTRLVGLFDVDGGDPIATRTLDTNGSTIIGGYSVTLGGAYLTGDAYAITPVEPNSSDARNLERMVDLQMRDADTGLGGFTALFNDMVSDVGGSVAAAENRLDTAESLHESALRSEAESGAVDLDVEAARLLEQQQAYQANAQVMSVARQLFDTLLNAL